MPKASRSEVVFKIFRPNAVHLLFATIMSNGRLNKSQARDEDLLNDLGLCSNAGRRRVDFAKRVAQEQATEGRWQGKGRELQK